MYNRYTYTPPPQRPSPTKQREAALYESLARGELNDLADRHVPLPPGMTTLQEKENAVNSLKKMLLAMYDVVWGLDGSARGGW